MDIQNLQSAHDRLVTATETIKNLRNIAAATQGLTGQAIMAQCDKLQAKVDTLKENILSSQKVIRKVVQDYEDADRQKKAEILKNAVGR
jgi:hypothetical protein